MNEKIKKVTLNPESYKNYLLQVMIDKGAQNMYLSLDEKPVLRLLDGLERIEELPEFDKKQIENLGYIFMDESEKEIFEENLTIDLSISYNNKRFRINISRQRKSIMIVIKMLEEEVPNIDKLGLPNSIKNRIDNFPNGIMLISGSSGSGKSTTASSIIEYINRNFSYHIVTLEDPIEYIFDSKNSIVNQKQIGTDINSYEDGLNTAFRQKADVIYCGEIRTFNDVKNIINLAESGHFIITTINSNSIISSLDKIINMFPLEEQNQTRLLLSETLNSIITQKLINNKDIGKILSYELLINTGKVSEIIRSQNLTEINKILRSESNTNMISMEDNLIELLKYYKFDINKMVPLSNDKSYFIKRLKEEGVLEGNISN